MDSDVTDSRGGPKTPRMDSVKSKGAKVDGQRKLPRPIVFWSLNEKTAFRRNRVVQTRMNMVMDDIATQRQSSIRWIRYEAHKFRQRSGKYYNHPNSGGDITSKNIAPQAWMEKNMQKDIDNLDSTKYKYDDVDNDSLSDHDPVSDMNSDKLKQKKIGIITEGRRPLVKFSANVERRNSTEKKNCDMKGKDDEKTKKSEGQLQRVYDGHTRSVSAVPFGKKSEDLLQRQKSAAPTINRSLSSISTSSPRVETERTDPLSLTNGSKSKVLGKRLSDTFFDRTKAACELRIDLKRRATIRGQGITTSIFTLNDALRIEREKFTQSREKIVSYMDRVEAVKRAERTILNKWTRGAFEQGITA